MKKLVLFFAIAVLVMSCKKEYTNVASSNKVLMLQVDYFTNNFEGGKEFIFGTPSTGFTIAKEYHPPSDIGYLKLRYKEINEPLFDGSIIWAGTGKMSFPENLASESEFVKVNTTDIVMPSNGFELIHDPGNGSYKFDYTQAWLSVQKLAKTREYLLSNPSATVKLFPYTPSVGGALLGPKWIIFLKN